MVFSHKKRRCHLCFPTSSFPLHHRPTTDISQHLTFSRKIGSKNRFENSEALDRLHLSRDVFPPVSQFWEAGVFRHLRSLLLLPLSPSPSLKPQAPQDVSQPNVILSRIFFLPPFFFLTQFRGEHTLSGAGTKAGGLSPEL